MIIGIVFGVLGGLAIRAAVAHHIRQRQQRTGDLGMLLAVLGEAQRERALDEIARFVVLAEALVDAAHDDEPGRPVLAYLLEHNVGSRRVAASWDACDW